MNTLTKLSTALLLAVLTFSAPTLAVAAPTAGAATSALASRSAADLEGDQWVHLAIVAGGSLFGGVLLLFIIGGVIRSFRKRRRVIA